MKVALLATLFAFGGSLAGFAVTTGGTTPAAHVAAGPSEPAALQTEEIVVRGKHRDCPRAEVARRHAEKT